MGSSHAYRAFDPRLFEKKGLNMFNLGSSSQSIDNTEILLRRMVNLDKVDAVVVEISPMSFTGDAHESTAFLVTNLPQDDIAFEMVKNRADIKSLNLLTQRWMRKMDDGPLYEPDDYVGKGYCEKFDSLSVLPDYVTFKKYNPKEEFLNAFKGIIAYAQENNINLTFTSQPLPREMDQSIFPEFYDIVKENLKSTNIQYLNYHFSLPLDSKDHFYDHSHLNQAGVEIFNEVLLKDLVDLKIVH